MSDTGRTLGEEIVWWAGVIGATTASILFVSWAAKGSEKQGKKDKERDAVPNNEKGPVWPILATQLTSVGDPVMPDRRGVPHKGRDLKAPAGSKVLNSVSGKVLRVIDGRLAKEGTSTWKAGLFVDVRGDDGRVYRYLHLGSHTVKEGQKVKAGQEIGTVAARGTSGVMNSDPHLHFEIRESDFDRARKDYGEPIEPLTVLPRRFSRGARA